MRSLLILPLTVVIAAAIGYGACVALEIDPHLRDMLAAAIGCIVASIAGVIPLVLTRGASQIAVSQAGLVGTVLHLLVGISIAGFLFLGVKLGQPFLYWMMAFYWLTLIVLVVVLVRAVKSAPVATAPTTAPKQ